jgi:hypothetical protein
VEDQDRKVFFCAASPTADTMYEPELKAYLDEIKLVAICRFKQDIMIKIKHC